MPRPHLSTLHHIPSACLQAADGQIKASDGQGTVATKGGPASANRPAFTGRSHILSSSTTEGPTLNENPGSHARPAESPRPDNDATGSGFNTNSSSAQPADTQRPTSASQAGAAAMADEQVQVAVIQLISAPQATKEVLRKLLFNIVTHPGEGKYRKIRLANVRIKETIVDVEGALELLQVSESTQPSLSSSSILQ